MKHPKIIYTPKIPKPFVGMCLPPLGIFIHEGQKGNEELLRHELVHWAQYERMGLLMYCVRYIFQLVFIGYETMPMEVEARTKNFEYSKIYHDKRNKKEEKRLPNQNGKG